MDKFLIWVEKFEPATTLIIGVFQTIFIVLAYFGLRYIKQHAKKVKVERRFDLIHDCMIKISKYVGNYHVFYKQVFRHHYLYYTEEIEAHKIVDKIIESFYELKPDLTNNDFLAYEIDAEVKLISDDSIKKQWKQLSQDLEAVEILFEQLYKIKGNDDKCIDFIVQTPIGLIGDDHNLKINFTKTYNNLMSSLLKLYSDQENRL